MGDEEAAPVEKSKFLPAVAAFVIVAVAVYVTGSIATWMLKKLVLPALALVLGWLAARVVYRIRD